MMMVTGRSGQAANAAVLAKARPAPIAKRRAEESREERRLKHSRFMVRQCWKIESPNINNMLSKPRLIIFCLLIFKSNKKWAIPIRDGPVLKHCLLGKSPFDKGCPRHGEGRTSLPRFSIKRFAHAKMAAAPIRSRTWSGVTPLESSG